MQIDGAAGAWVLPLCDAGTHRYQDRVKDDTGIDMVCMVCSLGMDMPWLNLEDVLHSEAL